MRIAIQPPIGFECEFRKRRPIGSLFIRAARRSIFNVLLSLSSPGDVVLTEALTYPGIKAAAGKLGLRLVGVTMDEQGILPDALGSACRQHKPKAVYLVPTMHNPTTVTLSPSRRKAIAEIIRKAGAIF